MTIFHLLHINILVHFLSMKINILNSDGTIPIFASIPMPIPIPIKNNDADSNFDADSDSFHLKFNVYTDKIPLYSLTIFCLASVYYNNDK